MASSLSGGRLFSKNAKEVMEFLTSMAVMVGRFEEFNIKEKNKT